MTEFSFFGCRPHRLLRSQGFGFLGVPFMKTLDLSGNRVYAGFTLRGVVWILIARTPEKWCDLTATAPSWIDRRDGASSLLAAVTSPPNPLRF